MTSRSSHATASRRNLTPGVAITGLRQPGVGIRRRAASRLLAGRSRLSEKGGGRYPGRSRWTSFPLGRNYVTSMPGLNAATGVAAAGSLEPPDGESGLAQGGQVELALHVDEAAAVGDLAHEIGERLRDEL